MVESRHCKRCMILEGIYGRLNIDKIMRGVNCYDEDFGVPEPQYIRIK